MEIKRDLNIKNGYAFLFKEKNSNKFQFEIDIFAKDEQDYKNIEQLIIFISSLREEKK